MNMNLIAVHGNAVSEFPTYMLMVKALLNFLPGTCIVDE